MTPVRQALTAVGNGPPILMDIWSQPFNATVGVDVSQATGATYGVQYTLSDINSLTNMEPGGAVTNPLWRADPNLPAGTTTSGVTQYQFPVFYVRVALSALASGTVYVEVLQGQNAVS